MQLKNYLFIIFLFAASVAFPQTGTTKVDSIKSPGLTAGTNIFRSFRVYVPTFVASNPNTPVPLIIDFHGTGSNAQQQQFYSGYGKIADTAHFIVVYPQGLVQPNSQNKTAWNSLGTVQENKDTDLKFIDNLLDTIQSRYKINACKIYATGMSIGGAMTYDVGCFLNARFAAIASVAGPMMTSHLNGCSPSHPTPVMHVHGDNDNVVPYAGFGSGTPGVIDVINYWVGYDNCTTPSTLTNVPNTCSTDQCTAENYRYPNGTNGSAVELYKIIGGGHTWPALPCGNTAGTNNDYSASMAIWKFLRPYCLDDLKGGSACVAPSVTTQPTSKTICSGNSTTVDIVASGTGLSYQWQVDDGTGYVNVPNSSPYSNGNTSSLTITGATVGLNGYKYQCVVSGTCNPPTPGVPATSNEVVLTVNAMDNAGFIYSPPVSCMNDLDPLINVNTPGGTFSVSPSGLNINPNTGAITLISSNPGQYNITYTTTGTCPNSSTSQFTVKPPLHISTPVETCNSGNYIVEFDITGGDGNPANYAVDGSSAKLTNGNHFTSAPIVSGSTYSFTVSDPSSCGDVPVTGSKTCPSGGCAATATISGDTTICPGELANIKIDLTGTQPWSITYTIDGTNQIPVTATSSPYTFTADTAGVYTITSMSDSTCAGSTSGIATVLVNSTISTFSVTETCNGNNYAVDFFIQGGDPSTYTIGGITGTFLSPTHYKTDPIASGTSYSITVNDTFACAAPIVVSGTKTCSGGGCAASATISGDDIVCPGTTIASTITIALTGTAPWTITYAINGADQSPVTTSNANYTFTANTAGIYTITSVDDANCTGGTTSGSATISTRTAISTSGITETCNGTNYVVGFDIAGGDQASYAITGSAGNKTSPTHYTSNPIASGTAYSFTINDVNNCTPAATVNGNKTCASPGCNATANISGTAAICSGASATISITLAGSGPWSFAYTINGGTPITATSTSSTYTFTTSTAGTYALSGVTDITSCSGTTSGSATITINSAITTSNKTETCSGGNYTVGFDITGGNPASYSVTGGAGSVGGNHFTSANIISGTAYSFTVNDVNNCTPATTVTGTKTCFTGPCNPTATVSGGGTVCNNTTVTVSVALTGTPPWSFTLDPGAINVTGQNTSPYVTTTSVIGNYTVSAFSDAACSGTTSGSAIVGSCNIPPPVGTGIEENSGLSEIVIYPNPTTGIINVSIKNANLKELQITILDILGTIIYNNLEKGITSDYVKQINMETLSTGLYYIKLSSGSEIKINKLIVQ